MRLFSLVAGGTYRKCQISFDPGEERRCGRRPPQSVRPSEVGVALARRRAETPRTSVQLQSTKAQTPHKSRGDQAPESKTNQQDRDPDEICKTSIPGSNPGGASSFHM